MDEPPPYARLLTKGEQSRDLERTSEPLPDLGLDLSPRGWRVHRSTAVLERTRLAASIMQLWAAEGGSTRPFFDEVNRVLQAAGSPEPLLTGLVSLSGTAFTMLSSLLSSDVEDLIGELIEDIVEGTTSPLGND